MSTFQGMPMYEDDEQDADLPKPTKRLAVLETEAHAERVVARAAGQDVVEVGAQATRPSAPSALSSQAYRGLPDWEANRPLEAQPTPPPAVPFTSKWAQTRGRFCALGGVGGQVLRVLRARRPF